MSKNILFIDAAARDGSRTRELAGYLIAKLEGEVTHLRLRDGEIPALDGEMLAFRTKCCEEQNFEDAYFQPAKQFASADTVVIAAPFWDNSFPAVLKKYIEAVSVCGITFRYLANGMPQGLCRGETLYYVTTAGGTIYNDAYGYGYVKELSEVMFGIKETKLIKAEGLDTAGADTDAIMKEAKRRIDSL